MKTIIISIFMAMMAIAAQAQQKSFYDFTVKTIDGEDISLSTFKGKKVLVVNVVDLLRNTLSSKSYMRSMERIIL